VSEVINHHNATNHLGVPINTQNALLVLGICSKSKWLLWLTVNTYNAWQCTIPQFSLLAP